ncbi:uncharacterized protein LOC120092698 [Benincasa hispida]|uniref:uncharacterized protein LOC120092698 n=1 Tax=Benincasa hispida TaxID=102211 RepID=UPI0019008029|nr:uncharacterized protein LOC120092698 [Benincasa hispida]
MFEYRQTGEGSLGARLLRIRQEGSYSNYVKKFVAYSAHLLDLTEDVLKDTFINGLEPTLRVEVISRKPTTLEECMREAQLVSDRNMALKLALADLGVVGPGRKETQMKEGATSERKSGRPMDVQAIKHITLPVKGNHVKRDPPMKRLLDSEFRDQLDKGLCFRCNEKYALGCRCKVKENRELMLFITNKEEETVVDEEEGEELKEMKAIEDEDKAEIVLRSMFGLSARGTMKLKGELKGKEVLVLIDCETTHNFVHQKIVRELHLPIDKKNFNVVIENGTVIQEEGVCKALELNPPALTVKTDFLAIDLRQMDLVLGIPWLCTTGFIGVHWPSLTMSFLAGNSQVVFARIPH